MQLNILEHCIYELDSLMRTLFPATKLYSQRVSPASQCSNDNALLTADETRQVIGLMRVNHSGEVCAQALYRGQALTAKSPAIKEQMLVAAAEEGDHLAWCEQRLIDLDGKLSVFNPLWYTGAFLLGAIAGLAGDKYSLGFLAETERQVAEHLQQHLQLLPAQDNKTRLILEQMYIEESQHAYNATSAGAVALPQLITKLMHITAQIMTYTSFYI